MRTDGGQEILGRSRCFLIILLEHLAACHIKLLQTAVSKLDHEDHALFGRNPVGALELAKARREMFAAQAPAGGDGEGGGALEEKRKYDKIIEWLEKGMPQG